MANTKVVEVVWDDCAGTAGWHDVDRAAQHETVWIYTVGILVAEHPSRVIVALSKTYGYEGGTQVGEPLTIPRSAIRRMRTIGKVDLDAMPTRRR